MHLADRLSIPRTEEGLPAAPGTEAARELSGLFDQARSSEPVRAREHRARHAERSGTAKPVAKVLILAACVSTLAVLTYAGYTALQKINETIDTIKSAGSSTPERGKLLHSQPGFNLHPARFGSSVPSNLPDASGFHSMIPSAEQTSSFRSSLPRTTTASFGPNPFANAPIGHKHKHHG